MGCKKKNWTNLNKNQFLWCSLTLWLLFFFFIKSQIQIQAPYLFGSGKLIYIFCLWPNEVAPSTLKFLKYSEKKQAAPWEHCWRCWIRIQDLPQMFQIRICFKGIRSLLKIFILIPIPKTMEFRSELLNRPACNLNRMNTR